MPLFPFFQTALHALTRCPQLERCASLVVQRHALLLSLSPSLSLSLSLSMSLSGFLSLCLSCAFVCFHPLPLTHFYFLTTTPAPPLVGSIEHRCAVRGHAKGGTPLVHRGQSRRLRIHVSPGGWGWGRDESTREGEGKAKIETRKKTQRLSKHDLLLSFSP